MTGQFNIKKFGFKLLQAAMLAAALVMVDSSSAWAQENAPEGGWNAGSFESYINENKSNIPTEPRKEQKQVKVSQEIQDILERVKKSTQKGVEGKARSLEQALERLSQYTTEDGYKKYTGSRVWSNDQAIDVQKLAIKQLDGLYKKGAISKEEYQKVLKEIEHLTKVGSSRAKEAAEKAGKEKKVKKIETREEKMAKVIENKTLGCKTSAQVRAEVTAGCWSCLVLEKVSSAFLYAAKAGLGVSQKAGVALLILGSAIWLAMWALKNVSSFTEIQLGNILNELFKFLFKVALAYWFISFGPGAISNYFIRPILSVGALIGQQFWDEDIKAYTEDYVWEDEYISEADQKVLEAALSAANNPGGVSSEEERQQSSEGESTLTEEEEKVSNPERVEPDEFEEIVQLYQKALIAVLQQYMQEIQNSCTDAPYVTTGSPKCKQKKPNRCVNYGSCTDKGHRDYVKQIYARAGSSGAGAYCMMTITAALEEIEEQVGGDIANFQTGKGYCLSGIALGAEYENSAVVGTDGGDVDLAEAIKYANVGDIIYIRVSGATAGQTGSGSGYHATTYLGGGKVISFNSDYASASPTIFGKRGKIIHTSEIIRQRLKKNPNAKIDKEALKALASGSNMNYSLVNYKGGTYKGLSGGSNYSGYGTGGSNYTGYGTGGSTALLSDDITYTGPADIIPKSVMNSMLGATRAITNTTAESMIVGRMIMCYSKVKNGGALTVKLFPGDGISIPNFFMWFEGALILCFGFLLTMAIAYYLMDISFKIGFAVLAMPIMAGLWPFGITQDKLAVAISIIAKSAALFAFLAITTGFGMVLISNAGNFDSDFYTGLDYFAANSDVENDTLRQTLNDRLYLFSPTFILLLFTFLYVFKMVQKTSSDITNKFFPDKGFGNSSPMHSAATMMTSWAKKVGMSVTGLNYAKDLVAYQGGRLMHGAAKKTVGAVFHPVRTAKNIGSGAKRFGQKVKNAVSKKK